MTEGLICPVDEVPTDSTRLFTMRPSDDDGEVVEVLLTRLDDGVVAYRNHCQHWTDVRLDTGDGALVRNDELVCQRHGATFERSDGECTFGPCQGARLDAVTVTVRDGDVYLAEPSFSFESLGPAEREPSDSGSRIGFGGT